MPDPTELGLPQIWAYERELALDCFLQVAGLEALAGLNVDIPRLTQDLIRDRDDRVLTRLSDVVDLGELTLLGDGERIPLEAIEKRVPHVSVVMAYETARALAALWPVFRKAAGISERDGIDKED
jgi:hypothetical protein